jgi:hypothetical protein
MPGSKSDFLELELLDHVLGNAAYTAPATTHIALFTVAPTDTGGGTEVTGGSYARVAFTNNATNWPAASSGLKQNGVAINFAQASADWGTVVAFGIFDASTSGNLLYWGWLGTDDGHVFTATTADVFTSPSHGFINTDQVRVYAVPGSTLPTGISAGTTYFVITVSGDTFSLSLTSGGAAIDITVAGAGLIAKITAKPILNGDTASFAINALQVRED